MAAYYSGQRRIRQMGCLPLTQMRLKGAGGPDTAPFLDKFARHVRQPESLLAAGG